MKRQFQGEFLRKYHVGWTKMGQKKGNKKEGLGCLQLVLRVAALFLSLWLKSCHLLAHPLNGALSKNRSPLNPSRSAAET